MKSLYSPSASYYCSRFLGAQDSSLSCITVSIGPCTLSAASAQWWSAIMNQGFPEVPWKFVKPLENMVASRVGRGMYARTLLHDGLLGRPSCKLIPTRPHVQVLPYVQRQAGPLVCLYPRTYDGLPAGRPWYATRCAYQGLLTGRLSYDDVARHGALRVQDKTHWCDRAN